MLRIGQVVLSCLILCDGLAAPGVPVSEGNRKMESMRVSVKFAGGIEAMPLEEYVAAVLAGESGSFRSAEALKAMAVAVRSYALHFRGRHAAGGFDFCESTHCQALRRSEVTSKLMEAAQATEEEMLWHGGKPVAAYYHANCGGRTEAPQHVWGTRQPYLTGKADAYCTLAGPSVWRSAFSKGLIEKVMVKQGVETPEPLEAVRVVERTPSGRARLLHLIGSRVVPIPATAFRFAIQKALGWKSLPSASFDVGVEPDVLVFSGRGAGHAVGLCQAGAERMGLSGKSYREILEFYYPSAVLAR